MIFVEVAVAAPVEQTLTYAVAEELAGRDYARTIIGRRVLVPLGRRKVTGYIVAASADDPQAAYVIKQISQFSDQIALFQCSMIPLFRWAADYYQYPLGLVIKAALPGGLTASTYKKISLVAGDSELLRSVSAKFDWAARLSARKSLPPGEYKRITDAKDSRRALDQLLEEGAVVVEESLSSGHIGEKVEVCYELANQEVMTVWENAEPAGFDRTSCDGVKSLLGFPVKLSEAKTLYHIVSRSRECGDSNISLRELRKDYPGIVKPLQSLEKLGVVRRTEQRIYRAPIGARLKKYPRPEVLTDAQQVVVEKLFAALAGNCFTPFLLHGVTGSGKTEVYLRAAEKTLAMGRDVLIIVPEIALATQLEAHLLSRFGELVGLMHSGMSKTEKFDQYCRVLQGNARVVIGARSAIFAPLENLGLIIVDEEHDSSLKQDDGFRYNGRDLAVVRGKFEDCVVILGSATPSVTSYANAVNGKYSLLEMPSRVGNGKLPEVEIVNLNTPEAKKSSKIINQRLREELERNILEGKQSILLLNRRGFSTVLLCQDCGTPVQCTRCHVSLAVHKKMGRLVCHYCGFTNPINTLCAECRSDQLVPAGFGTERVEEEVRELFPEARIARLDSDISSNRKSFLEILGRMHNLEIDILIGTQMIAKGHHFPNVTLVGVVLADGGMSMPDFRAAERTYQLLTQVIGRAGRGELPGKVIIQTMRPEHYAIEFARNHDYSTLFAHEMTVRRNPAFPPYARLVCLRMHGKVENEVQRYSVEIVKCCRKIARDHSLPVEILGPAPSPLDKIKDNYRWQVLLKGRSADELRSFLAHLKREEKGINARSCSFIIDVDPENMM